MHNETVVRVSGLRRSVGLVCEPRPSACGRAALGTAALRRRGPWTVASSEHRRDACAHAGELGERGGAIARASDSTSNAAIADECDPQMVTPYGWVSTPKARREGASDVRHLHEQGMRNTFNGDQACKVRRMSLSLALVATGQGGRTAKRGRPLTASTLSSLASAPP